MPSLGSRLKMLRYTMAPALAVLVTLVTGVFGNYSNSRGLPFPWVIGLSEFWPPSYDWLAFGLDVLFYAILGYGMVLGYAKYRNERPDFLPPK